MTLIKKLAFDKLFLLAFIAAPFFWALMAFLAQWQWFTNSIDWPLLLLVVLIYPVVEELCFRGFLQEQFLSLAFARRQYLQITIANILCSLAFVALHAIYHVWAFALMVFIPSLVFGFFRDRYHSVIPGMVLHSWYNSGTFWFLSLWQVF